MHYAGYRGEKMKFISARPLVQDAHKKGYAVPAFNTNGASYDITRAALEAAEEMKSPLILQDYEPNLAYRGFDYFVKLAGHLGDELDLTVPVALHIDHGKSYESLLKAIKAGFTSFMIDASHDLLEENIGITKRVLETARLFGISVEAEVGYVKGNEPKREKLIGKIPVPEKPDLPATKTDIKEAKRFVAETGVDMLAVSVGTLHGVYRKQDEIDFELLAKLRREIGIPLVQHGTCGIALENISRLAAVGMCKINFGEAFRFNYIKYFNAMTDTTEHLWHSWRIMRNIKDRLKNDMKELIKAVGSDGKAD